MKSRSILAVVLNLTMVVALLIAPAATTVTAASAVSPGYTPANVQATAVSTVPQQAGTLAPVVSTDVHHDVSLPLSVLSRQAVAQPAQPAAIDAINKILPNKHPDLKYLDKLKEEGIDPYDPRTDQNIQNGIGVPYAPNAMPSTILNWKAHTNIEGYYPPDTVGDVGYDPVTQKKYYVQWVNVRYAVWEVTSGAPVMVISPTLANALWSGFGGPCQTQNSGDPIVLFDQLSNRWFMSQFAVDSAPYYQCIAISQTADPTGAWYRYAFQYDATKMNDYPHFGVWPDGYYMTTNQFNNASTWGGAGVAVFERDKMLLGQTARMVKFDLYSVSADYGGMLPSDWDGSTLPPAGSPNYFTEVDDNILSPALGADAMRIWKFHVDWTNTANSTFGVNGAPNYTLPVASFDAMPCTVSGARNCVPQLGTSVALDVIGDRLMHRSAYRNISGHEALVLNHTVNAGSGVAGIRWYEVRDLGTTPSIYQQSTYGPDSTYRWMGSVAMDHVGNIALGFSASDATIYPAIRYAGRLAGDPLNTLAQGEATIINGTGAQTGTGYRWGDYSALTLDPVDDCTFYYSQEYLETTGGSSWVTRVGSFKFPNCSLGAQGTLAGTVTNSANSNPITGAKVDATLSPTQTFTAYSNPSGGYNLLIPTGSYTVTGAAYGFVPASISGVSVVSGTTTTQSIALTPAATYVISGFVKDSVTNDPLLANIAVIGTPFNPPFASVDTNPATGYYSMTVSGGQSYTLTASALLHTAAAQGVTPVGNTTANFNLVATTQNGGLIGYVRNFYNNAPVPNATVTVAAAGNPSDQTDANGYFEIFNLTPGTYTATATANLYSPVSISNIQVLSSNVAIRTFLLPTSQLNYNPAALSKTLTIGQIVTDTAGLVISNTGLGNLSFGLVEQSGGFTPLMLHQPYAGGPDPFGYTWVGSDEPGGPSYNWIDATGGTALGLGDDGEANVTLPFSMPFYTSTTTLLRVGNNGAALYNATTGDVGVTNAALNDVSTPNYFIAPFWDDIDSDTGDVYWMVTGSAPNRKVVVEWYNRPHYSNIGSATFELVLFENGDILYQYQDVNFGDASYNNGASATVGIRGPSATYSLQSSYNTPSLHDLYAICFDNPNNAGACGGSGYDAIPWLTETPITGTLAQSASQNIQLRWNADVAEITQPGTYTATLRIDNNDPVAQSTALPVALTVLPAATQAFLTGVVSTTGICDVNPAPISGAMVYIAGASGFTQTLATNAAGQYGYWLTTGGNPYTVTVSYAQHLTTTASVNVTVGVTTTQNFTLRLQQPCLQAQPTSLATSVQFGLSTTLPLTLSNSGATNLNFTLAEATPRVAVESALAGADVLVVRYDTTASTAMETALTALGYTFDGVTSAQFQALTIPQLLAYRAVFYAGTTGTSGAPSANETKLIAYLDAGGSLYISDNDLGYWRKTYPFYDTYLQAQYVSDDPLINTIVGEDIMNGLTLDVSADSFPDDFTVRSEGTRIMQYSGGNAAGVKVARNGYLAIYTSVDFQNFAGAANQQEIINRVMNFLGTADVPWLSETPITGTIAPAGNQPIAVKFDAASLTLPGDYTAFLKVRSNDPGKPMYDIPVTLTVSAPPTFGQINGVVNGLAACDAPGAPLNGAAVAITGGTVATATTDVNGQYSYFLLGGSAYTLTVSNPGYASQSTMVTVTQNQTTTTNFNLRTLAPCQAVSAASFSSTQSAGQVVTKSLTITNTGASALTWNFQEQAPALPAATGAQNYDRVQRYIPVANIPLAAPLVNTVQDGGFEATNGTTFANPYWGQGSTTYSTAICSVAGCTPTGGTQAPRTGTFWVWFGGASAGDVGYVQQTVVLTPGVSSLSFYLKMEANTNAGNFMKVSIDGTPVFTATTADQSTYAVYTLVTVDVTAFANGASHVVRFDSTTLGAGNFHVDDVALDITGPACSANALPWVTAVPASGTVAPSASSTVGIEFNSTGLSSGVYTGTLCLNTNDTAKPQTLLPVTLTVATLPAQLTINTVGNGTVSQLPLPPYAVGDVVTLTANAAANWTFSGWSGDLSGMTSPITITLTGNNVVTATFVSTCVPVSSVDFTYAPLAPKVGQLVTFNGAALTGTMPITYSWNFGDSPAVGSGTPITHLFPITVTAQSYTVTLTAANACSTVPVLKSLTIRPYTMFLPIVLR